MPWILISLLLSSTVFFIGFFPGWFDSAEFVLAAQSLGVSHPSGHPFWVLFGKMFSLLPFGAIAFRTGLLSLVATVLTLGLLFRWLHQNLKMNAWVSAIACLCVLLHPSIGLQTTRTEVYSLSFLLIVASFYFAYLGLEKEDFRLGLISFFIAGLSVTLQPLLAITLFPILFVSVVMNSKKTVSVLGIYLLFFLLGCSIDLFMPLRAITQPLLNWDNPVSFSTLYKALTARDFRVFFHSPVSGKAKSDLIRGGLFTLLPLPLLTLSIFGFVYFLKTQKRLAILSLTALVSTTLPWLLKDFYLRNPDAHAYVMPPILFLISFAAIGTSKILSMILPNGFLQTGLSSLFLLASIYPLLPLSIPSLQAQGDEEAFSLTRSVQILPPNSKIIAGSDHWLFPTWYLLQVEKQRPDVQIISPNMWRASWYRNQVTEAYKNNPVRNQFNEFTNLKLHPYYLQHCADLFHQTDPFDIRKSICAESISIFADSDKTSLDKQISNLELGLLIPPSNLTCKTGETVYYPFPLIPDEDAGFLVAPDFNYVTLGNFYLQCKQPNQVLKLAQREPQVANLRLLVAYAELQNNHFPESLAWVSPQLDKNPIPRGYFSLARATIHLLLKQNDQAKEDLKKSQKDLGKIEPITKLQNALQGRT